MLNWLKIDHLALMEHADVEFREGFNVVTGETGAGKSILLGTIALLLGGRADRGMIRTGCDRCEAACSITVPAAMTAPVTAILDGAAIPFDPEARELCLRRVITRSGTRNFVNDSAVTAQILKSLGECLIDIHSANEHHTIVSRGRQLRLLDRFAALEREVAACREAFERKQGLEAELARSLALIPSAREAHELQLTYDDICRVEPVPGEDEEVASRHQLAANSKSILELAGQAAAMLDGGEGAVADQLSDVYRRVTELCRLDPKGAEVLAQQASLVIEEVRTLAGDLEDYAGKLDLDEASFAELEERLSALFTLKRRYGPTLEDVLLARDNARERLELYARAATLREDFGRRIQDAEQELARAAEALGALRREAAQRLTRELQTKLLKLGFKRSKLFIEFTAITPGANGMDQIELMFSANPGEAPRPLRDVASSGELARLMLAVKAVLADADETPILVFDEIDVNLGGETAHQVGIELAQLARKHQVLCISHLAQVAVRGDAHFAVSKDVNLEHAASSIVPLDYDGRCREIARLLGGGEAALAHACQLVESAK